MASYGPSFRLLDQMPLPAWEGVPQSSPVGVPRDPSPSFTSGLGEEAVHSPLFCLQTQEGSLAPQP